MDAPLDHLAQGELRVRIRDRAGNLTSIDRTFSIASTTRTPTK
jgi:hypothetical protein